MRSNGPHLQVSVYNADDLLTMVLQLIVNHFGYLIVNDIVIYCQWLFFIVNVIVIKIVNDGKLVVINFQ